MDCIEFLDRYSDYDDSLVSGAELAAFREHLSTCGSCARYDRVLRKGRMLARQLPPPEPGDDFIPQLHRRIWRSRWERRHRPAVPAMGGLAAALAAVTIMVVSVWSLQMLDSGLAIAEGGAGPAMPAGAAPPAALPEPGPTVLAELPAWSRPSREAPPPVGWVTGRVDPDPAASYSPLVTGPPAYRSANALLATAAGAGGATFD